MQKILLLLGLTTIILSSFLPDISAESHEYSELKKVYDDQRWNLEKEFKEKFKESSDTYQIKKQDIYEKSQSGSITAEQTGQMLKDAFSEFVERQEGIKEEYSKRVNALNEMFAKKFAEFERIPIWVKKVMTLWNEGKISDAEYANFLSFLINHKIIESEDLMFADYNGYVMIIKAR